MSVRVWFVFAQKDARMIRVSFLPSSASATFSVAPWFLAFCAIHIHRAHRTPTNLLRKYVVVQAQRWLFAIIEFYRLDFRSAQKLLVAPHEHKHILLHRILHPFADAKPNRKNKRRKITITYAAPCPTNVIFCGPFVWYIFIFCRCRFPPLN